MFNIKFNYAGKVLATALVTFALTSVSPRAYAEDGKDGAAAETKSQEQDATATESKDEAVTEKVEKKVTKTKTKKKVKAVESDASGLKKVDIKVGKGPEAKNGDVLEVNYLGTLPDGKKFDSSYDRKQTFKFKLGQDQVIQGWHKGLLGMKKGGKRKLTIPPDLGYGAQGAGGIIPPNATLIFEVELVNINPKA